ncbi:MAG: short-chain dehydrogenase [Candidatus Binatia bacterium]|nr:MAG: short-chain dehydrogenase [Candidatus Binatia bacterium]
MDPVLASLFDLSGKVALVTGGSRGLGREMVLAFARAGADVVVASRKLDHCIRVAAEVQALGRRALAVSCHVGRWNEVDALIEKAYREFGRVDILVNNAGMSPLYPSLEEVSEELYDKVLAVNLKGPFRLATVIGARMARGAGGVIINVTSIAAERPTPMEAPYAAAKAGLNTLTVALARAFAPKVRVNAIEAGAFATDVSRHWDREAMGHFVKATVALQRIAEPREIVGTALYLASEASSYTNGAIIRVDGGVR